MRAHRWLRVVSLLALACALCTRTPARDPAVVQDVVVYVDKVKKWEPVEIEVLKAIRDVRRSQYVGEVHARYTKAWHDLHDSFAAIIAAMERKDYVALARATEAM